MNILEKLDLHTVFMCMTLYMIHMGFNYLNAKLLSKTSSIEEDIEIIKEVIKRIPHMREAQTQETESLKRDIKLHSRQFEKLSHDIAVCRITQEKSKKELHDELKNELYDELKEDMKNKLKEHYEDDSIKCNLEEIISTQEDFKNAFELIQRNLKDDISRIDKIIRDMRDTKS